MTDEAPEMIDAVFDISGSTLPAGYPFALWSAVVRHIPALAMEASVGILPLRTSASEAGMLLPKRAKLVLRLPVTHAAHSLSLSGQRLDIEGSALQLGSSRLRQIQPYSTLHAHLVTGAENEANFLQDVSARLNELGIDGKLICGMRNSMSAPDRTIHGYSLVIHDLIPDDSLRLQYAGLGAGRHYGCGIFVPYKVISDLD